MGPTLCVSSAWDGCMLESMHLSCPHVYLQSYFGGINGMLLVIYLRTNSDLCHLQHKLIGFIPDMKSVYSAVRTGSLNKAVCASSLKS